MTLIELDRDVPLDPGPGRRPPPWRYRQAGLMLAAVLLFVLGGAVPAGGVLWRDLGVLGPVGAAEPMQLVGGRIYTVAADTADRELTAWALDQPPRRLWSVPVRVGMGYNPVGGGFGALRIRQSGDVLLVADGAVTTALDARSGRTRWTAPIVVSQLTGGGIGIAVERVFRAGTRYDQASGAPGPLYFSTDGTPHTEPPIRTEIRGIDLATGRPVWTAAQRGSVTVDPVGGDQPGVLITASDRLTRLIGASGAKPAETALPELNGSGPVTALVVGDVAVVSYQNPPAQAGYDVRTLDRLWTQPLPAAEGPPAECRNLLCIGSHGGGFVVDPATGRPAWPIRPDAELSRRAGFVLETDAGTGLPVRLADPLTGQDRLDLRGWRDLPAADPDGALLLVRDGAQGTQTFAAVLPGRPELRLLGPAAAGSGECVADEHHLACREGTGVRVRAYRK